MNKTGWFVLTLVVLIVGGWAIFSFSQKNTNTNQPLEKTSLRLKWTPNAGFAGDFVAKDKGFWKEQGLDIAINPAGPNVSPIQLVVSGSDDFGLATGDQIILARAKGVPVVAIAVIYQRNPLAYASLKSSGITSPQQLVGKKVGLTYTDDDTLYHSLLNKLGIDPHKITEMKVGFDPSVLVSKQVDTYPVFENTQAVDLELGGHPLNLINPADYDINSYSNLYFTTEDMIKNHPDKVQRFLKGVTDGWSFTVDHPAQALGSVNTYAPDIDPKTNSASLDATIKLVKPMPQTKIGEMTTVGWEQTQNVLIENKILDKPIDLGAAYTNTFLDEIYK